MLIPKLSVHLARSKTSSTCKDKFEGCLFEFYIQEGHLEYLLCDWEWFWELNWTFYYNFLGLGWLHLLYARSSNRHKGIKWKIICRSDYKDKETVECYPVNFSEVRNAENEDHQATIQTYPKISWILILSTGW